MKHLHGKTNMKEHSLLQMLHPYGLFANLVLDAPCVILLFRDFTKGGSCDG